LHFLSHRNNFLKFGLPCLRLPWPAFVSGDGEVTIVAVNQFFGRKFITHKAVAVEKLPTHF